MLVPVPLWLAYACGGGFVGSSCLVVGVSVAWTAERGFREIRDSKGVLREWSWCAVLFGALRDEMSVLLLSMFVSFAFVSVELEGEELELVVWVGGPRVGRGVAFGGRG